MICWHWKTAPNLRLRHFRHLRQGLAMEGNILSEETRCTASQMALRLKWIQAARQKYGDLIDRYMGLPGSVPLPDPCTGSIKCWRMAAKRWRDAFRMEMQIKPEEGSITSPAAWPPGIYEKPLVAAMTRRPPPYPPPERVGNADNGQETSQASAAPQAS